MVDLLLDELSALRIAVKVVGTTREIVVIDLVERADEAGYGHGIWIQLGPAGACSD